jgi:hypothetical protein
MTTKAKDKGRLPPFVPLLKDTMKTPAWRALSHGARSLYTSLKARYSVTLHNNGKIYLSQRDARQELRSGFTQVTRWYRELQHFGFIVQTRGGTIGLNGRGTAAHWRLTELGCMRDPPTRDFERWDETPFKDQGHTRKTESRSRNLEQGAPEKQSITVLQKAGASPRVSAPENWSMVRSRGAPENRSISRLTTTTASYVPSTPPATEPLPPTMAALSEVMEPVAAERHLKTI